MRCNDEMHAIKICISYLLVFIYFNFTMFFRDLRQLDANITFCSPVGENTIWVSRHTRQKNLTVIELGDFPTLQLIIAQYHDTFLNLVTRRKWTTSVFQLWQKMTGAYTYTTSENPYQILKKAVHSKLKETCLQQISGGLRLLVSWLASCQRLVEYF